MDEDVFYGEDFGGLEDLDEDMLRAYLEGMTSWGHLVRKSDISIEPVKRLFEHKIVNIFVSVNFNICFGCSTMFF